MIDRSDSGAQILVVEDEALVALGIEGWLDQAGYGVLAIAASGEEAVRCAADLEPDLVLMDIKLRGEMDGIAAAEQIHARFDIPIVYMTAHTDDETLRRAKVTDPFGYIVKPVDIRDLHTAVEMALYKHKLSARLKESEARYRAIAELTSDYAYSSRVTPPDNKIICEWVTEAYERITGFTVEEMNRLGGWRMLIHPDDIPLFDQHFQILASGRRHTEEYRIINRAGQVRWLRIHSVPVRDEATGQLTRIYGAAEEITKRKRAEDALQQRNRELELLSRAGRAFNTTHDLDQVLAPILEEVRSLLKVTGCSAWLVDPDTKQLVCRQVTAPEGPLMRGWRLAPGQGLAGWVVQHGQGLLVPDVWTDPRHFKMIDRKTGLDLRSIMTIPLRATSENWQNGQGRVIGVIQVVDMAVDRFREDDLRLVESLASAVGIAVENARLYEQVQQDAETKATLLREINHRTKNNLAAIIGLLSLERRYVGPEDLPAYDTIRQKLVSRIQGLATVHSLLSDAGWTHLMLCEMTRQIVTLALQTAPPEKRTALRVPTSGVYVTSDQAHNLALVINELATNAVKYAWPGDNQALMVDVRVEMERDEIRFEFRDNGPGYPRELLELNRRSHSVGFELIRNIVRRNLRGDLSLCNDPGAVAVIRFKAEAMPRQGRC